MYDYASAQDIFDYVTTTGVFYAGNVVRARRKAHVTVWASFAAHTAWAGYKREIDPQALVASRDLNAAGAMLQEYYAQHVKELEA